MVTATFDGAYVGTSTQASATRKPGFFARFVKARQAQAERQVVQCLATYSDAQLNEIGFNAREIASIRDGKIAKAA